MKNVLILGSGMVAGPIIEYLLKNSFFVTVAGIDEKRAMQLLNGHKNGKFVYCEATDEVGLSNLISSNDLAVSLLPYKFHTIVAKICLKHNKHMVTTSYVKPEMQDLDYEARQKGLLFLNETGLDPGIDHMSAMRIIDHVHNSGGEIVEFYSITGALPDPATVDNPLGYKFSWSPKGVVLASQNDATYLHKGEKVYINPIDLFKDRFELEFPTIGKMDVYPNRNSIDYLDIYKIPEAKTIYRGTFRLKGWCETLDAIKELNLIDDTVQDYENLTYRDFVKKQSDIKSNDLEEAIAEKLNIEKDSTPIKALSWLGLLDNVPMNRKQDSAFEITSDIMIDKMWMDPTDRDMVAMQHIFLVKDKSGKLSVIKSRLLDFGDPSGFSSVAKTVALPAAVAVDNILNGKIKLTGVHRPVVPEIYNPIMDTLETMGIKMIEEYDLPENANVEKVPFNK